jgi:phosphatidylserine/phosphatidylglycerophosphate/cardiolipin synthase-like enzyme
MMDSALHRIPVSALRTLADSINSGRLLPPFSSVSLQRYIPTSECSAVAEELHSLSDSGVQAPQIAYVLQLVADAKTASEKTADKVELVWSGPEMPGAASRDTSVVVRELFSRAESSVLVAGFAISHGSEIFRALAERMVCVPNLTVRMFLNVSRNDDERASNEAIVQSFYLSFKTKHWPWEKLPQVFYDPRALDTNFSKRASLHAKCIVVDRIKCFVSSANFTESGQARNIEVGVLIEDTNLAASLHDQFESLVTHGLLRPVPGLFP